MSDVFTAIPEVLADIYWWDAGIFMSDTI